MKKTNWKQWAWILVVVIILAAIGLAFLLLKPHAFELAEKSVVFYSDEMPIQDGLNSFVENRSFLVAVEMMESSPFNQAQANASTLFSVVLIGNQKSVTQLVMVLSNQTNELLSCQTNFGNLSQNKEITAEECRSFLDSFQGGKVLINWPDSKLSRSEILVKNGSLEIHPSGSSAVQLAAYSALKKMFSNADEIIARVNNIAGQIQQ